MLCDINIDFLCEQRNITREQLKNELGMSYLQFKHPSFPKASKIIADYFGVSVSDFLNQNLSMPEKFRFLNDADKKEEFCENLLIGLDEQIEEWKLAKRRG